MKTVKVENTPAVVAFSAGVAAAYAEADEKLNGLFGFLESVEMPTKKLSLEGQLAVLKKAVDNAEGLTIEYNHKEGTLKFNVFYAG